MSFKNATDRVEKVIQACGSAHPPKARGGGFAGRAFWQTPQCHQQNQATTQKVFVIISHRFFCPEAILSV